MKERMKKLISIKSIPILALVLLIVLGTALADGRDPVSGSGEALLDLAPPPGATGTATLNIGGEEFTASLVVQITSQVVSDEGVLHATATHTFTLLDEYGEETNDRITTTDKEVIDTDGTLNAHLTITGGTGAFEGASGELAGHGQVQFTSPTTANVSYEIRGVISR
jgi:hypothetical protein